MNRDFFTSPTGQVVLVVAVLAVGIVAVRWQNDKRTPAPLPAAKSAPAVVLPRTLTREGARFKVPAPAPTGTITSPAPTTAAATAALPEKSRLLPLILFSGPPEPPPAPPHALAAPFGRLIPCETVVALESNRLETPVIGLVTEDVWHDGRLVIPAGAEVHARAALDRTRERLAVPGPWKIVWRTPDSDNGTELSVDGLALDRERLNTGEWGPNDGSSGLRGQVVKTDDDRELKLFAATFLGAATAALQDTRVTTGLLGEASLPTATARNAALSGTSAVLREYAQTIREAIARDGLYLHVPAGKPFYLYVTQALDLGQARRLAAKPSRP